MKTISNIPRDISWLSFNERVLQEASDPTVPLSERIKFLAIHSSNLKEFYRVRVAALKRMVALKGKKVNFYFEEQPEWILDRIQTLVLRQQSQFSLIWQGIVQEMAAQKVFIKEPHQLSARQKAFVREYFDSEVESSVIPLLIEDLPALPYLRDKSQYLGIVMHKKNDPLDHKYALIEVPTDNVGRFIILPSKASEKHVILLEDIIRVNLPHIFSFFEYDQFEAYTFNVTKDAEFDIDNDISTTLVQQIRKGLKNRRKGKAVRFSYDKQMHAGLLQYLIQQLNLTQKDNILPGERIHNFRDFISFPPLFQKENSRNLTPFIHPALQGQRRVTDVILKKDLLLSFPYNSYTSVIDLLRESAMDPDVASIQITAYRLASNSKIINALINAVRNGKDVTVMIELRARFNEQDNLEWKEKLEDEGVKTLIGIPDKKVHAKMCRITKRVGKKLLSYGFIATGNLNEKTARIYGDYYLLTANTGIMNDIGHLFSYLEQPIERNEHHLHACKHLLVAPTNMRDHFVKCIDQEIAAAKAGKKSGITLKLNSLSDTVLVDKLYEAAHAGVPIKMIIRSILCAYTEYKKFKKNMFAISIVDEYLEHARVIIFHNHGKHDTYISSADWMVRNLQHRLEVAVKITDPQIKKILRDILNIQLSDNVKARILDGSMENKYIERASGKKELRSQTEIYTYLQEALARKDKTDDHLDDDLEDVDVLELIDTASDSEQLQAITEPTELIEVVKPNKAAKPAPAKKAKVTVKRTKKAATTQKKRSSVKKTREENK